jgi:hypothetical protein
MMKKQQKIELEQRKQLQSDGWDVNLEQSIKSNDGFVNETELHLIAKVFAAKHLSSLGYRINSEVVHEDGHAEIDILAYGHAERLTYAVEIETKPDDDVLESKREKYLTQNVDDMLVVDCRGMPMNMIDAQRYVQEELNV